MHMMKKALVIGASIDDPKDTDRWNQYFKDEMTWNVLPEYITRDAVLPGDPLALSSDELRDETLALYDNIYKRIVMKLDLFDLIMIDRATVHGLVIDNPIKHPSEIEAVRKYYHLTGQSFLTKDNGIIHTIGLFNEDVLFLLFFHILSRLKPGGDLIFDTSSLCKEHVDRLQLFFTKTAPWDFNTTKNQVLQYDAAYRSGRYKEPSFIEFSGFKGFTRETTLMEKAFPKPVLRPSTGSDPVDSSFWIKMMAHSSMTIVAVVLLVASLLVLGVVTWGGSLIPTTIGLCFASVGFFAGGALFVGKSCAQNDASITPTTCN